MLNESYYGDVSYTNDDNDSMLWWMKVIMWCLLDHVCYVEWILLMWYILECNGCRLG